MLAKDIMATQVVTAMPDMSIRHVVEIMQERGVSGLPVVDDTGTLVGIITEGDLLERGELGAALYLPSSGAPKSADALARAFVKGHSWKVGDVMARGVVSVGENTSLGRIAALMIERHIKRVPIVRDGRLVGMVSRSDLLRGILSFEEDSTAPGDTAIRRSILTRLDEIGAGTCAKLAVVVSDGIVRLEGSVRSENEREAARVIAEGVHGVAGVVDHLQVEPTVRKQVHESQVECNATTRLLLWAFSIVSWKRLLASDGIRRRSANREGVAVIEPNQGRAPQDAHSRMNLKEKDNGHAEGYRSSF